MFFYIRERENKDVIKFNRENKDVIKFNREDWSKMCKDQQRTI